MENTEIMDVAVDDGILITSTEDTQVSEVTVLSKGLVVAGSLLAGVGITYLGSKLVKWGRQQYYKIKIKRDLKNSNLPEMVVEEIEVLDE